MLPRTSPRVAEVIKLANRIASDQGYEYVGTEHVLVAIHREGTGVGAAALARNNVTIDMLQREVDRLVKQQMNETWVFGRLPGSPHFKNVMSAAVLECQQLGASEVCTEHLLLALSKEPGCVAQQALSALKLTYDVLRNTIADLGTELGKAK